MPLSTRIPRAVALIAALCATAALPQERAAPRPELRFEPQEVKVDAGGVSEPVVVTLALPPGAALPAQRLPLTVELSRAIESLVTVEPEEPLLSLGRDGTARLVFRTDAATPRARYRVSVVAQPRPFERFAVGVLVLDVDNVRGLAPGPPRQDAQEVSGVLPVTASAELGFASVAVDDPAAGVSVYLDGPERTVYGGDLELPSDLVSIVPDADGWDGRMRFAWTSAYAEQYAWHWQVSLQPFPGPESTTAASAIAASGPVLASEPSPGQPLADAVNSFWLDFDDIPPLGQPFPTASEPGGSDTVAVAVVPEAAPASETGSATETGERTATVPSARSVIPAPAGGGTSGDVLTVPANLSVPEYPIDFHIRLVPLLPDGERAAPPSNAVHLHYEPGVDPAAVAALEVAKEKAAVQQALDALEAQAGQLYQLQLLEFRPVVFADPNLWGCVEVIEQGVLGQQVLAAAVHKGGQTYCPQPYQGAGDSFGLDDLNPIKIAEELADFASGLYEDLKQGVLDIALMALPCPSDLEGACRAALSTALDAALASAGIPPSLPDFEELKAAAKGKLVDLAMETALNELPADVVAACKAIPSCEQEIRNAIGNKIDQVDALISQSSQPHCGNEAEAQAHGREPLPCFNEMPGWKVKPATGAVHEPATVALRVTRTAAPMPAGLEPAACKVVVGMTLENTFAEGKNAYYGKLGDQGGFGGQTVDDTELTGEPFHPTSVGIPALAPNQSTTLTLAFTEFTNFVIPGFKTQQDPYNRQEHWFPLYVNGTGVLSARTSADASVMEGDEKLATKAVACGSPANVEVQIPATI